MIFVFMAAFELGAAGPLDIKIVSAKRMVAVRGEQTILHASFNAYPES